eukprot:5879974-Karenia_brevis.AAC.1
MPRGESLELVYVFLILLFKGLAQRRIRLNMVAYNTACKLLIRIRAKKEFFPPWTKELSDNVAL